MIYILCGESGAGKSTIEHEFEEMGINRIVGYTSRLCRDGEINGIDYKFTTNLFFKNNEKLFAEIEGYGSDGKKDNDRLYGTMIEDYECDYDRIVVLTPNGVRKIKKKMPELDIKVIYVTCNLNTRAIRYIKRCGNKFDRFDLNELNSRVERDFGMFSGFADEADLVVSTDNGIGDAISKIAIFINNH